MSYYENEYPEIDEIVYATVNSVSEHGVYFNLIEYNNKEGFLMESEMMKNIHYIKEKYFVKNKVFPLMVIRIDYDNQEIDLSHKRIKPEDRDMHIKYFKGMSNIYKITEEFSRHANLIMKNVLSLTMWKHVKKNDIANSDRKFRAILENPKNFLEEVTKIYPNETEKYIENVSTRITSTNLVIEQFFELKVYCENAISEIKDILNYNHDDTIVIEYINAPKYKIVITGKDNFECDQKLQDFLNYINEKIADKNIVFNLGEKQTKDRDLSIKYLPKQDFYGKHKINRFEQHFDVEELEELEELEE